jgi:hypothetical protein
MGSRVPKNGEPTRVPVSQERGTHPCFGFRVLGNGEPIVDFAFPGTEPETDTPGIEVVKSLKGYRTLYWNIVDV